MSQQYLFQEYVEAWRARREQERDHDAPPRKWYRFSLWKMVVGFVLLALLFSWLRNTHWGYVAGERIGDISQQFGLVQPPDRSKIRVSAVRPFGNLDYEWRISIPQGHDYEIDVMYWDDRRLFNLPMRNESLVSISSGRSDGELGLYYRLQDASGLFPHVTYSGWSWAPDWVTGYYFHQEVTGVVWGKPEQVFSPGEEILLCKSDIIGSKQDDGTYQRDMKIAIWLRPAKTWP